MPADIRNFFGGGGSQGKGSQSTPAKTSAKKTETGSSKPKRGRKVVVEDDEDEDEDFEVKKTTPKKATPKKPAKAKREPSPEGVATTKSDFFASTNKPKRSEPVKKKPLETTPKPSTTKANGKASKTATPASNGKTSGRAKKPVTYAPPKNEEEDFLDDDFDEGDDLFEADFKNNGRRGDDYHSDADKDDEPVALPHRESPRKKAKTQIKEEDDFVPDDEDVDMKDIEPEDDFVDPDENERIAKSKPAKTAAKKAVAGRKRKTPELDDDEEEEDEPPKRGRAKKSQDTKKSPVRKKAKKEDVAESAAVQAIYDSIPLVRPPSPPPPSGEKFDWRKAGGNQGAVPAGGSSSEMPEGAEDCLAGLTFVFTGVGQKWGREEGQQLVKRYGGKVTTAPSKKTSYVVLGTDAGPSKLKKIKENNIKTIDEDGLAALIERLPAHGGEGKAGEAYKAKQEKEEQKIKEMVEQIEKEERRAGGAGGAGGGKATSSATKGKDAEPSIDNRLWTAKHAPGNLSQICGNKGQVEKLQRWLQKFPKNQKTGFRLPGPDMSGAFRAVMIHGPPGIGKTTAAHLVAKLEGYDIVESNASDTRSKRLVEEGLKGVLSTTSLLGYFAGDGQKVEASRKKLVLIMDEVDGMSAGDRGGVGALAAVCKKSQIPMILICNDRRLPKMKPFDYVTFDLPFRRPTVDQIRSRIMTIAFREGMKMPPNVVNALIEGSRADIRQVVNMISTAKLDEQSMDYDKSKEMSKAWEKHIILKPWDITSKILGPAMFADSSKATLNDKIELYFNDHEFSPLMLQENYLNPTPNGCSRYQGKEKNLKWLELAEKAADSISDGDLVDRMIHGSQQQWSLMPTHAVFSFVRPASFVSGPLVGSQTKFTAWLGKNSNQQKLTRMVKEIQAHMRLRSSGDRHEVRQQYVPMLWSQLVKKLELEGKEAVPDIIELMDSYFLTKDDFDAILELGVGYMDQEKVKTESQAKAAFTRLYNQQSHPLPFMKASSVVAPKKATKEKPDLEEAIDESEEGEVVEEAKEEDEDADLSKDKYVKQPKKKPVKKAQPTKSGKGKKRKAADEDDEDEESEEDVKPKGRGKGKAAVKGKGKR